MAYYVLRNQNKTINRAALWFPLLIRKRNSEKICEKKSSEMSGFRSHRSRFRREKLTDQANNQEQNSVFSSSLGQKLASFKSCPDPDLEQKFNLLRSRPLFFGACGTCTTFSKAT